MTDVQTRLEARRPVRYIEDPTSVPAFRAVTHVWHFPSGDVLLEREERRDCLLPDVDRVDVPASAVNCVNDAVALETDTTVHVSEEPGGLIVNEFDRKIVL
ncbi:hypothetical protein ACFQGE_12005 [Halomicroarcula sp. GCM10025817]|uniref:hypothetical protein n=1 Tax=Haloarcula TaxID=2237 RepID=UPI0023E7821C|nr:hypothetical protein [Halomicroarcula sp. SYNS111]